MHTIRIFIHPSDIHTPLFLSSIRAIRSSCFFCSSSCLFPLRAYNWQAANGLKEWAEAVQTDPTLNITLFGLQVSVDTGSMTWGDGTRTSGHGWRLII